MSPEIPILRPAVFDGARAIHAGFTTRRGGVSEGPYRSLNLGLSTGDNDEKVEENRRLLGKAAGISSERFAIAGQVHKADVRTVRERGLYPGFDGLVTDVDDLLLVITTADCAAILLADAQAGVIGACHSGWRGTVAGISGVTVAAMEALGAAPDRICAYVSPCISTENFEVGPEVAARFENAFVHEREDWPRPHVDLKAAIKAQLCVAGVPGDAIEISPRYTTAETENFYSYRAENGVTGRMMGFIGRRSG